MENDYIRNQIIGTLESTNYANILEIYADDCLLIPEIEQHKGISYFGIFSSPELLESALSKIPSESNFQLLYLPDKKQIKNLPNKFDFIILRNLYPENSRETIRLLRICKSCLMPEGKIICAFPATRGNELKEISEDIMDLKYIIEGASIGDDITYLELRR